MNQPSITIVTEGQPVNNCSGCKFLWYVFKKKKIHIDEPEADFITNWARATSNWRHWPWKHCHLKKPVRICSQLNLETSDIIRAKTYIISYVRCAVLQSYNITLSWWFKWTVYYLNNTVLFVNSSIFSILFFFFCSLRTWLLI